MKIYYCMRPNNYHVEHPVTIQYTSSFTISNLTLILIDCTHSKQLYNNTQVLYLNSGRSRKNSGVIDKAKKRFETVVN